jgi:hypothetical protein
MDLGAPGHAGVFAYLGGRSTQLATTSTLLQFASLRRLARTVPLQRSVNRASGASRVLWTCDRTQRRAGASRVPQNSTVRRGSALRESDKARTYLKLKAGVFSHYLTTLTGVVDAESRACTVAADFPDCALWLKSNPPGKPLRVPDGVDKG